MFQVSDERWLELLNQRNPKEVEKLDRDWVEAIDLQAQAWKKRGQLDRINDLLEKILTPDLIASMDEEERQKIIKMLLEQEKQSQPKEKIEETGEKKAEE